MFFTGCNHVLGSFLTFRNPMHAIYLPHKILWRWNLHWFRNVYTLIKIIFSGSLISCSLKARRFSLHYITGIFIKILQEILFEHGSLYVQKKRQWYCSGDLDNLEKKKLPIAFICVLLKIPPSIWITQKSIHINNN